MQCFGHVIYFPHRQVKATVSKHSQEIHDNTAHPIQIFGATQTHILPGSEDYMLMLQMKTEQSSMKTH